MTDKTFSQNPAGSQENRNHNSVENPDSELLRRIRMKRHMSGLMCPPMGALPLVRSIYKEQHD